MNLGPMEILFIVILILVIFGPNRVHEIARALGRGMREAKSAMREFEGAVQKELETPDSTPKPAPPLADKDSTQRTS